MNAESRNSPEPVAAGAIPGAEDDGWTDNRDRHLAGPLEGANVTIRANGQPVGHGEVVAVGDTLGVRLLWWS